MRTITQTRNSRFSLFTTTTLLALLCATAFAQQKGTFTDTRDGKTYKTVKIGTQTWMAENLNYNAENSQCYGEGVKFVSADSIAKNCNTYGRLYNWGTAIVLACPSGWHLPTSDEWDTLINFAGGIEIAGKKLKVNDPDVYVGAVKKLKANGTDDYGFSALMGGGTGDHFSTDIRNPSAGLGGHWWSASLSNENIRSIHCKSMIVGSDYVLRSFSCHNYYYLSVRCVQGEPSAKEKEIIAKAEANVKEEVERAKAKAEAKKKAEAEAKAKLDAIRKTNGGTFTDTRDKKTYLTIKIGEQTWMAENLNYADKDSKCYNNTEDNCKNYGRLYNWETATKACPKGWHLPSKEEWSKLRMFVSGAKSVASQLKTTDGWKNMSLGGGSSNGTDDYGFSALPGGYGDNYDNTYRYKEIGVDGEWWGSTEENKIKAHTMNIDQHGSIDKSYLLSVRCLQGEAPATQPAQQPAAKSATQQPAPQPQPNQKPANQPASQPQPSQKPANQPASQPQPSQKPNENCSITFPKKACVAMPAGTCKMAGGKVVDKCP